MYHWFFTIIIMKTVLYGPSLLEIIIKDTFFQLLPRVSVAVVINAAVLMCLCVDCSLRHFHNYCYCQWLLSMSWSGLWKSCCSCILLCLSRSGTAAVEENCLILQAIRRMYLAALSLLMTEMFYPAQLTILSRY